MRRFCILIALSAVLALSGRVPAEEHADYVVLLTDTDLRTEAGYGKPTISKVRYLDIFRVKKSALGEGRQPWYGLILREERIPRTVAKRGWILRLPGESDPLLKDEVPVFHYPGDTEPPKLVKTRWLSRTGNTRHAGAWTEVGWNSREDRVDEQVGFVPASDAALLPRVSRETAEAKIAVIRANPKWTPQMVGTILRGEVREGYSRDAVILALGEPPVRADLEDHREKMMYRVTQSGPVEIVLFRGFVESVRRIDDSKAILERR